MSYSLHRGAELDLLEAARFYRREGGEKLAERFLKGAANIGYRPTVTDSSKAVLEVHLLDFDSDLYGEHITVIFRHKIRDEQKFGSLQELQARIAIDVQTVRDFFAKDMPL